MLNEKISKNMSFLFIASWMVMAFAAGLIALILQPDSFSMGYWLRIGWVEILIAIFFISSNWVFYRNKENAVVAISPSTEIITIIYCLGSFFVMLFFWTLEDNNEVKKIHLVIQIMALAVYLLLIIQIRLSSYHARVDMEGSDDGCKLPNYYVNTISVIEQSSSPEIQNELKKLREKMKYSLVNTEKIKHIKEYKDFTQELNDLLSQPEQMSSHNIQKLCVDIEKVIISMKGN